MSRPERLAAGLAAYLDHVQAQPTGWRAVLAARTGEMAEIYSALEGRSHALVLQATGVEHLGASCWSPCPPGPGWSARPA